MVLRDLFPTLLAEASAITVGDTNLSRTLYPTLHQLLLRVDKLLLGVDEDTDVDAGNLIQANGWFTSTRSILSYHSNSVLYVTVK